MSSAAPTLGQRYARSPRVVGRRIGEEFVLVPLAGRGVDLDAILNLNRVAAFIWERFDGETSGAAIVAHVLGQFDVARAEAERDYLELVATLAGLGALVAPDGTPGRRD